MSELTHDTAEEGFHEIQLSGKQIVFLFMAATVVFAVIFLTGVLVGRGVRNERAEAGVPDATVAAATPPPVADAGPTPAEPPAPAETPDELSYHKRLQGETAPPEQLKPEAPPPAATAPPAAQPQPQPSAVLSEPPAPRETAAGARPGGWIVQVTGLREAAAAQKVAKDLSSKGFPAFVVNPEAGMPVLYRVQVGGYATRVEADQIARRIEQEENFKPFVRQAR